VRRAWGLFDHHDYRSTVRPSWRRGWCGFSTALKRGERVLIDAFDVPDAMVDCS
jgi:hypothetical protein